MRKNFRMKSWHYRLMLTMLGMAVLALTDTTTAVSSMAPWGIPIKYEILTTPTGTSYGITHDGSPLYIGGDVTSAVAPPVWQFTFRDALGDSLRSDGQGPYRAYTPVASTPCPFQSPGLCGRDLDVTNCSTGLHNNFYLNVGPTRCPKVGETVPAWANIEFVQAAPGPPGARCNWLTCTDMFIAPNAAPYQTTFTRTGKDTYVWRATGGLFDHYLDDCNNLTFVEQCPLTFEVTIFKAPL
jgi:hypothetical protein